ncbi:hypothetical protein UlMin_025229 [Ulmus minor]
MGKLCLWKVRGKNENSGGELKRVVVVGGGIAGSLLARSLQDYANVVLVGQKEYFEITWASLRGMVEPTFAERIVVNHSDYLTNVQIVSSAATNVTDTEVITADGHSLAYHYLVIATGHAESVPRERDERLGYYRKENEKIKSANSILIVGGGPTGVQLAAEIVTDFPEKKVTLVHRGQRLLEFIGTKASQKALDWLVSKKVEVLLDQSVDLNNTSNGVIQTSKGEIIQADCHFVCTGKPIGSSWLKETVLSDSIDIHGRLTVDENLRVRGHKNVFAIGDITDIKELKQGYLAQTHAQMALKNLKLLLMGGNESKLGKYKPSSDIAIVTLGRKAGVFQFPFMTLSGYIPGKLKSGDLFVGSTRQTLGLKRGH